MQLFVNQLTNVDFSYLHPQRGLVGETWLASAALNGALDEQGMVCDFGIVKKTLRNWLDDELDHRLLVPARSELLTFDTIEATANSGERIRLLWRLDDGEIIMESPADAVTLIDAEEITAESVSIWCREQLRGAFQVNVEQLELAFEPEAIEDAFYHYSHGLKKHRGNCQRIAHGHRSRIQIWLDGNRSAEQEHQWAERWADIYIGTRADIESKDQYQIAFRYISQQGEFYLNMPAHRCYLIDTDSTVELIAEHLAAYISNANPDKEITVRAFEGLNKGAKVVRPAQG